MESLVGLAAREDGMDVVAAAVAETAALLDVDPRLAPDTPRVWPTTLLPLIPALVLATPGLSKGAASVARGDKGGALVLKSAPERLRG